MRIIAIVKMPTEYFSSTVYILFYFKNDLGNYSLMISWENSFGNPFWEAIIVNEWWSEHKEAGLMCRLPKDWELEVLIL
jgi:hypothetical protein